MHLKFKKLINFQKIKLEIRNDLTIKYTSKYHQVSILIKYFISFNEF